MRKRVARLGAAPGGEQPPAEMAWRLAPRQIDVLEDIADGFVALDWEWRVSYANPAALRLLERDSGELVGTSVWAVYPQQEADERIRERLHRAMEQGEPCRLEINVALRAAGTTCACTRRRSA